MPGLLPHTIELCARDRRNPAGFWGQPQRRPDGVPLLVPVLLPAPGPALRSRDPSDG